MLDLGVEDSMEFGAGPSQKKKRRKKKKKTTIGLFLASLAWRVLSFHPTPHASHLLR
jgi:hypothetical protein